MTYVEIDIDHGCFCPSLSPLSLLLPLLSPHLPRPLIDTSLKLSLSPLAPFQPDYWHSIELREVLRQRQGNFDAELEELVGKMQFSSSKPPTPLPSDFIITIAGSILCSTCFSSRSSAGRPTWNEHSQGSGLPDRSWR